MAEQAAPPDTLARWTLAYEADGTEYAAWTLRHGTGADTVAYDTNATIGPDDSRAARTWAAVTLVQHHNVTVDRWEPHRPGHGTTPAHWTAKEQQ
jgi:hypothetical protein